MKVVDASALVEVLLRTPAARPIMEELFPDTDYPQLAAPCLIDVEVVQVVRRYAQRDEITADRGRKAVEDLEVFPFWRYPMSSSLPRIWDLRANFSAYDAAYLVLAEVLEASVVTCDGRFARAIERSGLPVEVRVFPPCGSR